MGSPSYNVIEPMLLTFFNMFRAKIVLAGNALRTSPINPVLDFRIIRMKYVLRLRFFADKSHILLFMVISSCFQFSEFFFECGKFFFEYDYSLFSLRRIRTLGKIFGGGVEPVNRSRRVGCGESSCTVGQYVK